LTLHVNFDFNKRLCGCRRCRSAEGIASSEVPEFKISIEAIRTTSGDSTTALGEGQPSGIPEARRCGRLQDEDLRARKSTIADNSWSGQIQKQEVEIPFSLNEEGADQRR
jgi:hypothetical protein